MDMQENNYQALASWLNYRLDSWRNHRNTNYTPLWDEYYRLWRGIWDVADRTRQAERSKLISPALQQAIESSVAELEEATFGRGKWFDIKDDYLDPDNSEAEYIRNLLQEDLEKAGCKDAICEVFLNSAIYGTGIGKIVVKPTKERAPIEKTIEGTLATTRTIVEYDAIDVLVEPISPKEFLIDPSATSIDDALGVAHEVVKPRYHIIEGINSGIYMDVPIDGDYDTVQFGYDDENKSADESDSVKICEYWGLVPKRFLKAKEDKDDFEYNDDELVEAVVTMVNDQYILRVEENAFMMNDRPFISYQHDIVPSKFWGRGVAEKGYNPQKALDAEMRARIDSLALTTTPMLAADATRLPRGTKFEVRAGKTVLTNGNPREAIMPLDMGQTDQNTFNQVASLQNMIQMGTGSADTGAGAANDTASGMSMMQSAAIKRQKRTLMNFQNTFLIPLINKCMYRKIQFDVDRYPVTDYKFVPYSTMGIMAKELEMQQMVQMLQTIPQDSPAFEVILLALFQNSSIHNRDQIVNALMQGNEPNEQQEMMQEQVQQMQMQQLSANVQKTLAEAKEEEARSILHQAEAMKQQPNEIDIQEKILKLQKDQINLQKIAADIENKRSETARNIPEVEHLKSETILNLAKAREAGSRQTINNTVQ